MHLRSLQELAPGSRATQSGQQMREGLSRTLRELRGLSHGLGGIETGDQGERLSPALVSLAERLSASGDVRCTTVCAGEPALGRDRAVHVYRIVQEAVGNAMRHGKAEHVEIRFEPADGKWRLSITDDGVGVPACIRTGRAAARGVELYLAEVRKARAL